MQSFVQHHRSNRAIRLSQRRPSVPAGRERLRAGQHKRGIQSCHRSDFFEPVLPYPLSPQLFLNFSRVRNPDVPFVRHSQSHLPVVPRLVV